MNRLLVITRGSSVLPLRASVKWPSHKLYLSPAQGTQGNRTVCGIAQGVSSHSWQISTPVVRTLHTAWSFVAYPYSCLNSHTASKVGRRGVDSEVMCGPGFLEGICPTQACTLSMGWVCSPYPVLCVALETQGTQQGVWFPSASAPLGAVGASFVQQMGAVFQFPQQSPKACSWPEAWSLIPGDRGALLKPAGILVPWLQGRVSPSG